MSMIENVKPGREYTELRGWYDANGQSFMVFIRPMDRLGNIYTPDSAAQIDCYLNGKVQVPYDDIRDNIDGSFRIKIKGMERREIGLTRLKIVSRGVVLYDGLLSGIRKSRWICRFCRRLFEKHVARYIGVKG